MLSRLQDLKRSAARLRCALKAYGKLDFAVIPGMTFHASPAGLTEHLGKDPENSLQGVGGLNSWVTAQNRGRYCQMEIDPRRVAR